MKSIYYILTILLFVVGAFFVVTYASGYKVDITNRQVSQTGMIIVEAGDSTVFLDDEPVGSGKVTLRSLNPDEYVIKVSKDGYFNWYQTVDLLPGEAEIINDVVMFKENPEIEEYKIEDKEFFEKLSESDGLYSDGHEIYQNNNFVTRFSESLSGLTWYNDRRYISYTYQNKLKVMRIDGTNEFTLLEKNSSSPAVFVNSGRYVIYEHDGKVFRAKIK